MNTHRSLHPTSAVVLATALLIAGAAAVTALPVRAQSLAPSQDGSSCVTIPHAYAAPQVALVGSQIGVTATVLALCASTELPLNIVLVLDGSNSMAGDPSEEIKRQTRELVDRLDLKDHPLTQVGVVEINEPPRRLCALTNRASQVAGCIGRLAAAGGSDIAGAVRLGLDALRQGRTDSSGKDGTREVLVLITDGANPRGCLELMQVSGEVKQQGVLLVTVCASPACVDSCLHNMATSLKYHFAMAQMRQVMDLIVRLQLDPATHPIKSLSVMASVGDAFDLDPAGIVPPSLPTDDRSVLWCPTNVPKEGVTMSLRVRATTPGFGLEVLSRADGIFTDQRDRGGRFDFRRPQVDVLDARSGAAVSPLTATLPLTNVLSVDRERATVGQVARARYRLQLPAGEAARLNVATLRLRLPDHLEVRATWRDGRPDGQPDVDRRGAQWLVFAADGAFADAYDLEVEFVATGPGDGGIGVIAYGWDGRDTTLPIAAAVSAPIHVVDQPSTPVPPATLPTSTATPRAARLYLPVALAESCLAGPPNDVVVVIDTSTSMAERLPGGGTKQAAAVQALSALVARLDAQRDRIALVTFDRTAVVRRPLGDVGPGVVDALRSAPLANGTAMGAGLWSAGAVLASPDRRPDARGTVVLLTDGRSSPDTPEAAVAAADALRAAGATVFAAGLGAEVDRAALDGIAGGRGEARVVADGAALGVAFGSIGGRLGCRSVGNWGGRLE
ncbi:MAG: VWA domain-containing protein [Ardenticatenales bacterium]|nr:VWA domain-containing protein [Ardenticatenales bacterium]